MKSKIFRSTLFVAAVVLVCGLSFIMGVLYDYFDTVQRAQLQDELSLAAIGTERDGIEFLEEVESDRFRITWVASDGTVLYDTHADAATMENHANREEIIEALYGGTGSATRHSDTLLERTIYATRRLSDGTVLRISVSRQTLLVLVVGVIQPVCIVAILAIILSAILSSRVARKITQPLNELDLENPMENDTYDELSPILHRIHHQHGEIKAQMRELERKSSEFAQIISHMREGLVLLDQNRTVLSINPAAKAIFGADESCVGRDLCTVDRRQDMSDAVDAALANGRHELRTERNGREYQFVLSRIEDQNAVNGLVILAFDVTESENAERTRREFTANVSHELKTPLQSIIGSAEMLKSGMVRPEDTQGFVEMIHKEASRLVLLIEDIIRLSRLDEGMDLPHEEVDLLAVAQETVADLRLYAEQKKVTLYAEGEPCIVSGVRGLIYEIVHNLADNAVKYNREDGSVKIRVTHENGHSVLSVSDTGIGIPPEHHSRIFERFYRVDKSHSRQSGGTGLGLSIVKHAVQYHNAKLELSSTPGIGTTITVIF